uniref:hypothetical protein n=1 Tax=Staphylococcus saprophyticus TaxID=29385 RepID=UPI001CDA01C5
PINHQYHYQYKNPTIFSKHKHPTPNLIISQHHYKILKQPSPLPPPLQPTFTQLNSPKQPNQHKHHIKPLNHQNSKLNKQNKKLPNQPHQLITHHKSHITLLKTPSKIIKKPLPQHLYHKPINIIHNKLKTNFKHKYTQILTLHHNHKPIFQPKHNQLKPIQFHNTNIPTKPKHKPFHFHT